MSENATVARAATHENGIRLDALVLIGTFGTDDKRHALVRYASGKVERVTPGEKIGGREVLAISPDSLILRRGRDTETLEMPKG